LGGVNGRARDLDALQPVFIDRGCVVRMTGAALSAWAWPATNAVTAAPAALKRLVVAVIRFAVDVVAAPDAQAATVDEVRHGGIGDP